MKSIHELLEKALKHHASDLVLKSGVPPAMRVDGRMQRIDSEALSAMDTRELAYSVIFSASRDTLLQYPEADPDAGGPEVGDPEMAMARLQEGNELDVVFTIPKLARVRANLFLQRGAVGAALRIMPLHPYSIEELRLPPVL